MDYDQLLDSYMQEAESVYRYYWNEELKEAERQWLRDCSWALSHKDRATLKALQRDTSLRMKLARLGFVLNKSGLLAIPTGVQSFLSILSKSGSLDNPTNPWPSLEKNLTVKNRKTERVSYPELALGGNKMKAYTYDVFISHSSKDKPIVERIVQDFRREGITYWVDHEQVTFGDYVTGKIEDGLRESKNVLVCVSSNLGRSNWCTAEHGPILNRELSKPSGKKVIPLRLDNCSEDDIPTLLYDIKRANYSNTAEYSELLKFLKS